MSLARLKYQPSDEELPTGGLLQEEDLESNSSTPSVLQAAAATEAPTSQEPLLNKESIDEKNSDPEQTKAVEQKEKRFPLKRDCTQNSVSAKEANDDDWAKRNQGKNKVLNLVAKFSQEVKGSASSCSGPSSYKSDYGVGKKIGQIQQNKFQ